MIKKFWFKKLIYSLRARERERDRILLFYDYLFKFMKKELKIKKEE